MKLRLRRLEAEQRELERNESGDGDKPRIVQHVVTPDVVAEVVSRWTGVPVKRLVATEAQQLLKLEETLSKAVVGQKRAVKTVSQAVLRSRAGLADPDRPTGVFMFFGCSGTGMLYFVSFPFSVFSKLVFVANSFLQAKHFWQKHLRRNCSTTPKALFCASI